MLATVIGKMKKPYKLDNGNSGISCRLSLFLGSYYSDPFTETLGEGEQIIEVRCPEKLFDLIHVKDEINVELVDGDSLCYYSITFYVITSLPNNE